MLQALTVLLIHRRAQETVAFDILNISERKEFGKDSRGRKKKRLRKGNLARDLFQVLLLFTVLLQTVVCSLLLESLLRIPMV